MIHKLSKIAIILILVPAFLLSGCGFSNNYEDQARKHLSEKYEGVEFIFTGVGAPNQTAVIVHGYPEWGSMETERIRVVIKKVNGKTTITDNYFQILTRESAEKELQDLCTDLGLETKAFMWASLFSIENQFDSTKTYEDFREWENGEGSPSLRSYCLLVKGDNVTDKESCADRIIAEIKAINIRCSIGIYFCTDEQYEYYNRENYYDEINALTGTVPERYPRDSYDVGKE